MNTDIIKRNRTIETYSTHKLQSSIRSACLSVRTPTGEAETTALRVAKAVEAWLHHKPQVTSADLRRKSSEHLQIYNPEASYLYSRLAIMV